jgi:hypothetical protein
MSSWYEVTPITKPHLEKKIVFFFYIYIKPLGPNNKKYGYVNLARKISR